MVNLSSKKMKPTVKAFEYFDKWKMILHEKWFVRSLWSVLGTMSDGIHSVFSGSFQIWNQLHLCIWFLNGLYCICQAAPDEKISAVFDGIERVPLNITNSC